MGGGTGLLCIMPVIPGFLRTGLCSCAGTRSGVDLQQSFFFFCPDQHIEASQTLLIVVTVDRPDILLNQ